MKYKNIEEILKKLLINNVFLGFTLIASLFISLFTRNTMYWNGVNKVTNNTPELFQDELGNNILNNGDGFYFLTKAKQILGNLDIIYNPNNYHYDTAISYLTAFLGRYFDINEVAFQIPSIIAVMIIIPMFLIGKELKYPYLGIVIGFVVSITHSFYNRTVLGYYDNDGLVMFSLLMFVYITLKIYNSNINKYELLIGIFILSISEYIHGKFLILTLTILIIIFLLQLYMNFKKKDEKINEKIYFNLILLLALIPYGGLISILLLTLKETKYFQLINKFKILLISITLLFTFILYENNLFDKVINYSTRTLSSKIETKENIYTFFNVNQTIRENNSIEFDYLSKRIANSEILLILGILGYVFLINKNKFFIVGIPFILIGFSASFTGLRYTIYAIPFITIGLFYLSKFIEEKKKIKNFSLIVNFILFLYILDISTKHMQTYIPYPTIYKDGITQLKDLQKYPNDKYVLSWWDYAYPINYYALKNTLVDGGYHQKDNFIISHLFFSNSPKLLANFGKEIIKDEYKNNRTSNEPERIEKFLKNTNTPYNYINSFEDKNSSNEFFIYFPLNMLEIAGTVHLFSQDDIITKEKIDKNSKIFGLHILKQDNKYLHLSDGLKLDMEKFIIFSEFDKNIKIDIRNFNIVNVNNNTIESKNQLVNYFAKDSVIINVKNRTLHLLSEDVYNSNYIQMGILKNYDNELFELISESNAGIIYKTK